jgi:hypothetical protein
MFGWDSLLTLEMWLDMALAMFFGCMVSPTRYGGYMVKFGGLGVGASQPCLFLNFLVVGHPCAFSRCHVAAHDWATWWPFIGPCHHSAQSCHVTSATSSLPHVTCQVVVRSATWLYGLPCGTFPLVHGLTEKSPKMSDTWQPLVLPHHHVDVIMTHVTLCVCHVPCMDADVICTDADVNSTDVDSSLLTGLG